MTGAAAWRASLVAGLAAFACSAGFGHIPGLTACGPTGGLGPIIAFELARTPGEVAALFGAEPCRSMLAAAQRTGLWLDALGFIPGYTAFLCLAAWATGNRLRAWIVAALLIAGLADEIEGALLFAILRDLPGTRGLLDALWWPVHLKFALLGGGTFALGAALVGKRRLAGVIGGGLIAAAGFWASISFRQDADVAMTGFTLAWTALLLLAALGAVWPRLFAAPRPAPVPPSA